MKKSGVKPPPLAGVLAAGRAAKGRSRISAEFLAQPPALAGSAKVDKHTYAKLGTNAFFEAQPAVMHFGGYVIHKVHQQTLRIVNTSSTSQRVHVVPPSTPYFRVHYEKKGLIAPGMAEEITVEFMPTEWRYYYDCLRLHSDKENLMVPLHAYPVANDFSFPTRLDFGACQLGETVSRTIPLQCNVPIQFEYQITVLKDHPDFTVSPPKGIIPASGKAEVVVTFCPASMTVSSFELQIALSQFGFEPVHCTIVGSSAPGLARDREFAKATKKLEAAMPQSAKNTTMLQSLAGGQVDPAKAVRAARIGKGAGAAFDPGTALLDVKLEQSKAKHAARQKQWEQDVARIEREWKEGTGSASDHAAILREGESLVEGVRVPADLSGTQAAAFVLTQAPGKLKPRDLAQAIARKDMQRARQQAAQEQLKATQGLDANVAPGPGLPLSVQLSEESAAVPAAVVDGVKRSMGLSPEAMMAQEEADDDAASVDLDDADQRKTREMVFLQDVADIDQAERSREFQSQGAWLGELLMMPDDVAAVHRVRDEMQFALDAHGRVVDRRRRFTAYRGPQHVPPTRVVVPAHVEPDAQPDFNPHSNDLWRMRRQVLLRLKAVVRKTVVRRRAAERLAALRQRVLPALGKGRDAMRELIEEDHRRAQAGGAGDAADAPSDSWLLPGLALGPPPSADRLALPEPVAIDNGGAGGGTPSDAGLSDAAQAVLADTPRGFPVLAALPMPEAPVWKVMGYTPLPLPPAPAYVPTAAARPLRAGAAEEEVARALEPRLDTHLSRALTTTAWEPSAQCRRPPPPAPSLDALVPDPGVRRALAAEAVTESKPQYLLQSDLAAPYSVAPPPDPLLQALDALDPSQPLDVNGLLLTHSQAHSASLGCASLRYLASAPQFSDTYAGRHDRLWDVATAPTGGNGSGLPLTPALWTPPALPQLLSGPQDDDDLSDDSESDVEYEPMKPTMDDARKLFAVAGDGDGDGDGGGGDGGGGDGGGDGDGDGDGDGAVTAAAAEGGLSPEEAAAAVVTVPRDAALVRMADAKHQRRQEDLAWLRGRLKEVDRGITDPALEFHFDAT